MAVTTEKSTQYTIQTATNSDNRNPSHDYGGNLAIFFFTFTQGVAAGDIGSIAQLFKLPPGKFRYLGHLSRVVHSAFGTARTLDIGFTTAFTKADGTAVSADEAALHTAADVSAAGSFQPVDELLAAGEGGTYLFDSREGVIVEAQVEGGTIPAAATLDGYLVFSRE